MPYQPSKPKAHTPTRNPLARLHSPGVMMILIFLLVVYLVYLLAENFGLEGEGGWLGEVFGASAFIAGIIVVAVLATVIFLGLKKFIRRQSDSPWMEIEQEIEPEDDTEDTESREK